MYKFKPDETFNCTIKDPITETEIESKCTIIGYDTFNKEDTNVMVNVEFPTGYSRKFLMNQDELEQAKLLSSKLYKSLA